MQCVILAAGEGIRMRPLTLEKPKPLLSAGGKTLLEHIVGALPENIDELILVVGYLGDQIRNFCGGCFFGRPVRYVTQEQKTGTAHALLLARPFLADGRFLLLYADDLFAPEGIRECLTHERALLVAEHLEPRRFGVVVTSPAGTIERIIEKPAEPPTNLVSTGAMVLDHRIFDYEPDLHPNGEYYLTSMFDKMLRDHPVTAVVTKYWFPIATPEDLARGEQFLRSQDLRSKGNV